MMNFYFGCAELYFYLSVFGQITHQSKDFVELSKNDKKVLTHKKGTHHTKKEQNTQKKFPFFF
jgi:hypothetical protein